MVQVISTPAEIPSQGAVVIDFFATWCGPCKHIAPKFEEMSKIFPSIVFLKVDVDESAEMVDKFNIRAMPTFVFLKNGSVVKTVEGADIRAIGETLEALSH